MGPRSHERGNAEKEGPKAVAKVLQWGRVLMNAETDRDIEIHHAVDAASMGPRSHERGNPEAVVGGMGGEGGFNGAAFS